MGILFNNKIDNIDISFYFKEDEKFINCPSNDLYYNNNINLNIDKEYSNLYKRLNLFKKTFLNKNERCLFKSISFINKKKYEKALNLLNKHNEKGKFLTDIYTMLLIVHPDLDTKKDFLDKIINNLDSLGEFFNKYKIKINFNDKIYGNLFLYINDNDFGFVLYLVLILSKMGQDKQSLNLLLTLDNKSPIQMLLLGELYLKTENYSKAIITLQNLNSNDLICKYSLLLLGRAFRKEGLLKSSIAILRKTRRRSKNFPVEFNLEGRYQLALSLEEYSKSYLAKKEYEKILTINYKYKDTKKRLRKLKNI